MPITLRIICTCILALCVAPATVSAASTDVSTPVSSNPKFVWQRDITYTTRANLPLKLDVVRAKQTQGVRPLVIIVHGGGWWSGTKSDNAKSNLVQQRFALAGFTSASIDYRLACDDGSDETHQRIAFSVRYKLSSQLCGAYIPDQIEDIHSAVIYLRRNAKRFNADPNKIALVGISAGGHLSLLAAATASYGSRVQGVANWSGATFVDDVAKQDPTKKGTIVGSLTNAIGCTYFMCGDKWRLADPLRALQKARWPFAVISASSRYERIVNPKSLVTYDKEMAQRGWKHDVRIVEKLCHGTGCATFPTSGDGRALTTATARFFMQSLSNPLLPKKPDKKAVWVVIR